MNNNRKNDQLKIGVILSYVSTGMNMIIQLCYTPLMIRLLGQSEYGLYTLVGSVVSYLSLFSLGFTGAYLKFYSKTEKENGAKEVARLNGMFLSIFLCMSLIALLCGMILSEFTPQLFGNKLTNDELGKASILMKILVINIAMTFPASLFESMISAHERFLFQRVITLFGIVLNPFVCLPFLLMGHGSVVVVVTSTAITLVKLVINVIFCIKKLKIKFIFGKPDVKQVKEISGFSFFIFLNMIIDQVNWSVDKYILGRVAGTTAVAVYGVGSQINSLFIQFSTAISTVFAPRINRIAADKKTTMQFEFTDLMIKVGRIQLIVLGLLASGFVIFGNYFITQIYAGNEYRDAYVVALLLVLPALVPLIQNVGIEIQRAVNKHKMRSVMYLGMALVNTIISIPLAMHYGPVGSAAGTAISLVIANGFIMNVYYKQGIGIDIIKFWKSILSLIRSMVIPGVFGFIIMRYFVFSGIVVYSICIILYSVVYCISIFIFGMNKDERDIVKKPITKLFSGSK